MSPLQSAHKKTDNKKLGQKTRNDSQTGPVIRQGRACARANIIEIMFKLRGPTGHKGCMGARHRATGAPHMHGMHMQQCSAVRSSATLQQCISLHVWIAFSLVKLQGGREYISQDDHHIFAVQFEMSMLGEKRGGGGQWQWQGCVGWWGQCAMFMVSLNSSARAVVTCAL